MLGGGVWGGIQLLKLGQLKFDVFTDGCSMSDDTRLKAGVETSELLTPERSFIHNSIELTRYPAILSLVTKPSKEDICIPLTRSSSPATT